MNEMTKTDRMIAGLQIMRGKIMSASFYNSDCDASFFCSNLSDSDVQQLQKLGWNVTEQEGHFVAFDDGGPWS